MPARAAYTAFIVAYSRPFSGNKDRDGNRVRRWWQSFVEALPSDQKVLHDRIIEERNTLVAHTDERRRQIEIHQHYQLHSGLAYGIGDEQFFQSSLSLIERLLSAFQAEIERLEPFEYAKAEERRRQVPPPAQ